MIPLICTVMTVGILISMIVAKIKDWGEGYFATCIILLIMITFFGFGLFSCEFVIDEKTNEYVPDIIARNNHILVLGYENIIVATSNLFYYNKSDESLKIVETIGFNSYGAEAKRDFKIKSIKVAVVNDE